MGPCLPLKEIVNEKKWEYAIILKFAYCIMAPKH